MKKRCLFYLHYTTAAGIVWVALLSCSPVKIRNTEAADTFKLADYKTFDFYEISAEGNALAQDYGSRLAILEKEISGQLEKRNLQHSASNPDLLINMGIVVEEKVQTRETSIRDAPVYIGQRNYIWKSEEVEVGRYREGSVTVHLVDSKQSKLVWQSTAEGVLPKKAENIENIIKEGVEELFNRLPSK